MDRKTKNERAHGLLRWWTEYGWLDHRPLILCHVCKYKFIRRLQRSDIRLGRAMDVIHPDLRCPKPLRLARNRSSTQKLHRRDGLSHDTGFHRLPL